MWQKVVYEEETQVSYHLKKNPFTFVKTLNILLAFFKRHKTSWECMFWSFESILLQNLIEHFISNFKKWEILNKTGLILFSFFVLALGSHVNTRWAPVDETVTHLLLVDDSWLFDREFFSTLIRETHRTCFCVTLLSQQFHLPLYFLAQLKQAWWSLATWQQY